MKQRLYLPIISAVLALSACTDGIIDPTVSPEETVGKRVQVSANTPAEESRVQIIDNITNFHYNWEDDDSFVVFSPSATAVNGFNQDLFMIDEGQAGSNGATFSSAEEVSYKDGEQLYAFYNGNKPIVWDKTGNITIDISGQDGTLTDKYQYMFGQADYDANGTTGFSFKHLVSTIKVNITLPEGVTELSSIELGIPRYYGDQLTSKATLIMNNAPNDTEGLFNTGDLVYNWNHSENYEGSLTIHGSFKPAAGNVVTVYFYALPVSHYHDNSNYSNLASTFSSIFAKDQNGREFGSTMEFYGNQINGGVVYEMNTGLYQLEDFANENSVNGSSAQPYEIANVRQFYTYMFRNSRHLNNAQSQDYAYCSYFLSSDMDMNNEMFWAPCEIRNHNIFDGRNHEITGSISMSENSSLFSTVQNHSILKNLIFNASPKYSSRSFSSRPIFAWDVYDYSTMEHCINKSDIGLSDDNNGKYGINIIAMYVRNNCSIIACGNEGNMVCNYSDDYNCGILLHNVRDNCVIDGCYNSGKIVVDQIWNDVSYGLVGNTNNNVQIQNCWSNGDVAVNRNENNMSFMSYGLVAYEEDNSLVAKNCYWNSDNAISATSDNNGTFTGCGEFANSNHPTDAQIKALNDKIITLGYEFDSNGCIKVTNKTVVRPSEIEEW